ncbi:MAG: HDIG domain-containing protein [Flavobacteriaceae bacterium]|nr:HDIG domain-containing protein [Flavobacteriaceae bacterium]
MSASHHQVQKRRTFLFTVLLHVAAVAFLLWIFPSQRTFNFQYTKGRPWNYENLYAPFDFEIRKTDTQIQEERDALLADKTFYYRYDNEIVTTERSFLPERLESIFPKASIGNGRFNLWLESLELAFDAIYKNGVIKGAFPSDRIKVVKNNQAETIASDKLLGTENLKERVNRLELKGVESSVIEPLKTILIQSIRPNLFLEEALTENAFQAQLSQLSLTRGIVFEGKLIIAKGEVIDDATFQIIESLRTQYQSEQWQESNTYYLLGAYGILIALLLLLLLLYLKRYRLDIYQNTNQLTFIFINILLMVSLVLLLTKIDERFVYLAPLSILPLVLKNFFDARLALFVHLMTLLILGMVLPNAYEFLFLQISAGIVVMLGSDELHKRTNLFAAAFFVTLVYIISYVAFHGLRGGVILAIDLWVLILFVLNGMLTLFSQPLIYLYEKLFSLVSDVSLLELSDTNSKLLKELSEKAPGTFNHSLQVANLCEAAANAVGANSLLLRVGALYHDIGKLSAPEFFTENQIQGANPHEDLTPTESAQIIRRHVIQGIEIARKNNLPDRVIDFIRTHHGNSLVYYFYKKQLEEEGEANEKDFRYPGPIPFSKETAILMMCDAVEAASKSLKQPDYPTLDQFVERIISGQLEGGQYSAATITLKEIEIIKAVLKKKLTNIYHVRVEYPE